MLTTAPKTQTESGIQSVKAVRTHSQIERWPINLDSNLSHCAGPRTSSSQKISYVSGMPFPVCKLHHRKSDFNDKQKPSIPDYFIHRFRIHQIILYVACSTLPNRPSWFISMSPHHQTQECSICIYTALMARPKLLEYLCKRTCV